MKRVILLGTGTGVGKTFVGSRLAATWAKRGAAIVQKPIESGINDPSAESDAEYLAAASPDARVFAPRPRHFLALPEPISPHLAARRAGISPDLDRVAEWIRRWESKYITLHDNIDCWLSIVETAGGAFSPLTDEEACVDLARRLDPALRLLVAPDALGVLHDVRATLIACAALGHHIDAVVLSAARPKDASTGSNRAELEQTVFPLLGSSAPRSRQVVPVERDANACEALADLVEELSVVE